jgi:hypothetical protein
MGNGRRRKSNNPHSRVPKKKKRNEKEGPLMVDKPIPEEGWQPLKQRQEEAIHDTRDVKEENLAKSSPELTPEKEWKPLRKRQDEAFFETINGTEEDLAKFSPELINESQEVYTDAQRANLFQKIQGMNASEKLRLAIFANREVRNLLIHDPKKVVSLAVLRNGKVNENEALHYAQRKDLSEDVILTIAKDQKWKKNYPIKLAVVSNPKTPLSVSISLLAHLQDRDLKLLSRANDVSSVLRRKAQEILLKKRSGR